MPLIAALWPSAQVRCKRTSKQDRAQIMNTRMQKQNNKRHDTNTTVPEITRFVVFRSPTTQHHHPHVAAAVPVSGKSIKPSSPPEHILLHSIISTKPASLPIIAVLWLVVGMLFDGWFGLRPALNVVLYLSGFPPLVAGTIWNQISGLKFEFKF